ncbi:unnamed protein product [Meloidogyne enterolobii]|uniref:Uncharacterized protein n=1 Tax=Meloidogyne enterolobii TaxID=390850 RepID=A0ACB1AIA0_MELEN
MLLDGNPAIVDSLEARAANFVFFALLCSIFFGQKVFVCIFLSFFSFRFFLFFIHFLNNSSLNFLTSFQFIQET